MRRLLPGGDMEGKAADVVHVSVGEQNSPLEGTALGAASSVQGQAQLRQNDACLLQSNLGTFYTCNLLML